jgi:hypothetical protein
MIQQRLWRLNEDYDTLVKWWEEWEFGNVPKECLPPDGVVVEHEGSPVCAAGLYIGIGTRFAFMEWLVTDKHAPPKITHKAIKLCLDSVFALAKEKGMTLVYTTTKEPSLQKRYVKYHDMTLAETEVQTFLKNLTDDEYEDLEWIIDEEQYWIREGEKSG